MGESREIKSAEKSKSSRLCIAYRQFNALCKKNAILKLRHWIQLLIELIVPIGFVLIVWGIKSSAPIEPEAFSKVVSANRFMIPKMEHMLNHTSYPYILCHDNNLFYRCTGTCQDITDDAALGLFHGSELEKPGDGYWSNAHNLVLKNGYMCEPLKADDYSGLVLIFPYIEEDFIKCQALQFAIDICNADEDFDVWRADETLNQTLTACEPYLDLSKSMDSYHSSSLGMIKLLNDMGMSFSVPEDEVDVICEKQIFAIAPAQSTSELVSAVDEFIDYISTMYPRLSDFVKRYDDEADVVSYIKQDNYEKDNSIEKIGAAVIFEADSPDWEYSIRMNYTKSGSEYWLENIPTTYETTDEFQKQWEGGSMQGGNDARYLYSGFLVLQQLVDEFIIQSEVGDTDFFGLPSYFMAQFPSAGFTEDSFWGTIAFLFAFFMVIAVIYPISNMIKVLVQEKELRLREGMRMMGLSPTAHMLSWVAHFVIFFMSLAILMSLVSGPLFKNSAGFLIFSYYMCYFLAVIAFCFFISTFFSRAKTAAIMGMMIFFGSFFIYFTLSAETSRSRLMASCLLPACCFAIGTDAFVEFEEAEVGVTFETVGTEFGSGLAFSDVLGMLLVDVIVYGAVAWYLSQVLPSQWGTSLKPWFLFTKAYWQPQAAAKNDYENCKNAMKTKGEHNKNENVQPVAENLLKQIDSGECVMISQLNKTYSSSTGKKVAVKDLDLAMYQGQITALLGHNGAGKTTTISMLTGMIPITSGNAFVQGYDVATEMGTIREFLGVCPQHDILYPDLTVWEHLDMYASFKGVSRSEKKAAVEKMIVEVGLTEKRYARAHTLSGGQKRKLSLAIAFIGDSKVVFLDEPTSGMDPYSRRFTWDVIQRNREGRIIVLTTHFMDEADLLGDRIAIMSHGALRCCGSSLFLKSRYGVGYNLTLVKKVGDSLDKNNPPRKSDTNSVELTSVDENMEETKIETTVGEAEVCNVNGVMQLISKHIPEQKLLSNVGAEMTFQLPQSSSHNFQPLLAEMDSKLGDLGVETYGLSVTTLEEVFLKVAAGETSEEAREAMQQLKQAKSTKKVVPTDGGEDIDDTWKEHRVKGWRLLIQHFRALFFKRAMNYKRDRKALLLTLVGPGLVLLFGIGILQAEESWAQPKLSLNLDHYNTQITTNRHPIFYADNCTATQGEPCSSVMNLMDEIIDGTPVSAYSYENESLVYSVNWDLLQTRNDYKTSRYGAYSFTSINDESVEATIHTNFTGIHALPIFLGAMNEALLGFLGSDATITVSSYPVPLTASFDEYDASGEGFNVSIFILLAFAFIPAGFAQYIVRERETKTKHQQVVSGVHLNGFWISSWIWDFLTYMIGPYVFTVILLHAFDVKVMINGEAGQALWTILLLYGLAVVPFTYMTTFLFKSPTLAQNINILFHILGGLMLMMTTLILSFFEKYVDDAKIMRHVFRLFPQFCLADSLLRISFVSILKFVDPNLDEDDTVWHNELVGYNAIYLAWEIPVYIICVLIMERVLAGSTPIAQQWDHLKLKMKNYVPTTVSEIDEDVLREKQRVESGGAKDDAIILNNLRKAFPRPVGQKGCKEAVKGLSLGIPQGQCFGLLGINGAGKTTTLSMLSGEQPPSDGYGTLKGLNIAKNPQAVHQLIGYCPQFDAIFTSMTARENLRFYGMIKGIPLSMLDQLVAKAIKQLDLTEYADRLSGGFSGGNKRKLSVAIAMIGGPQLIFLDEPSTGMDPVARRFMWEVITRISTERAESSIILTTHSMEECEALCTRIGIMVGGQLRCLGSSQHLKSRFGLGFQLEVGARLPSEEDTQQICEKVSASLGSSSITEVNGEHRLKNDQIWPALQGLGCEQEWMKKFTVHGTAAMLAQDCALNGSISLKDFGSWFCLENRALAIQDFVSKAFTGSILRERQNGKARFEFPPQSMPLGNMFGILESNREQLQIEEYSLSQTTLEQIFNFFASQQEEETGQAKGIVKNNQVSATQPVNPNHKSDLV